MSRQRAVWLLLLLGIGFVMPVAGQDNVQGMLSGEQLVSGVFIASDENASHIWEFEATQREIVTITVQRVGGVFAPRMTVFAPDGSVVSATSEVADPYTHQMRFEDGLPRTGTYRIEITPTSARPATTLTQNDYTLRVMRHGQAPDIEAERATVESIMPDPVPDYFVGALDTETFPELAIYGDVTIAPIDAETIGRQFQLTGGRSVMLDDTTTLARVIRQLTITEEQVAFRTVSDTLFVTDGNIRSLSLANSIVTLVIEADDDSLIALETDFYAMRSLVVLDGITEIQYDDGQQMRFNGQAISVTRRGGINGQGPNIEPIVEVAVDNHQFATDRAGWFSLGLLDDALEIMYDGWRFSSDEPSGEYFQDESELRFVDIVTDYGEQSISFDLAPRGLATVAVQSGAVSLTLRDGRQYVDQLDNIDAVLFETPVMVFEKSDGTVTTILGDETRIVTPRAINRTAESMPVDDNFLPQNFNNLGHRVSDYHPHLDVDFALNPLNRINGNFIYSVDDYAVESSALALRWSRTYNSLAPTSQTPDYLGESVPYGGMGSRWRHAYQIELDVRGAPLGEVMLILDDGSQHIFERQVNDPDRYRSDSLLSWRVEYSGGVTGVWTAYSLDGLRYDFDGAGRLHRISDASDTVLTFSEMPQSYLDDMNQLGRVEPELTSGYFITEDYGRRLAVYIDALHRVRLVQEVQGRLIAYDYDGNLLIGVDYLGFDYEAQYQYQGEYLTGIEDVNSPYARAMAVTYDDAGRVIAYTFYPESEQPERYAIRYDAGQTVQSWKVQGGDSADGVASREMIWTYDDQYRLTSWVLPDADWVYRWRYSDATQSVEIIQPTRTTLRLSYDAFGYLIRFTDPLFADRGAYTFRYQDDAEQQVRHLVGIDTATITDWMRYDYGSRNQLIASHRVLDDETTLTTRYIYDTLGQLSQVASPAPSGETQVIAYAYDVFGYPSEITLREQDTSGTSRIVRAWELCHDGVGRLLGMIDPLRDDAVTSITWQPDRNLIEGITVDDIEYTYRYDSHDNLVAYQAPDRTELYTYDAHQRLTSVTDRLQRTTAFAYDSVGNVIGMVLPDGGRERYSYGLLDNLTRYTTADGVVTQYDMTLDVVSNQTAYTITNAFGEAMTVRENALGRVVQVADFDRNGERTLVHSMTYDVRGRLVDVVDNFNRRMSLSYSLSGQILSSSIDASTQTRYDYNSAGFLDAVIAPDGLVTAYAYDVFGQPTSATQLGQEQRFTYDLLGNLTQFTDENGAVTAYTYDELSRLLTETDALGYTTTYEYEAGNLVRVVDPRSDDIVTSYAYDAGNRLIAVVDALGERTEYVYDDADNLVQVTEPTGLQTTYAYGQNNQVIAVTQPDDREFLYGRDVLGRVVSETNPLGQTTSYTYNVIGEIGRITDPSGVIENFGWSLDGNLANYTLSNGVEIQYLVDSVGRLTRINDRGTTSASAVNTSIGYDAGGRIEVIEQGNSSVIGRPDGLNYRYTYDDFGRIVQYLPPETTVPYRFGYDATGNLVSVVDPADSETQYIYDDKGQMTQIIEYVGTPSEQVAEFDYDAVGNVVRYQVDGGVAYAYQYDAGNRLTEITQLAGTGETRVYQFAYDAGGRLIQYVTPANEETNYSYDLFGNLVSVQQVASETVTTRYAYDAIDNLTQIELPEGQVINMTYDGSGRRVRYTDAMSNTWAYRFDDVGNITQISNPLGNSQNFEFDLSNRLTRIVDANGAGVDFSYGGFGHLAQVLLPENDSGARETIDYDMNIVGQLLGYTHGDNQTRFERNLLSQVDAILQPDATGLELNLNEAGVITSIVGDGLSINREVDSQGRVIALTATDSSIALTYDAFDRVLSYDDDEALSASYTYDAVGRLRSRTMGEYGTIGYTYDELGRPIEIEFNGESLEIAYNLNGWRTSITRNNGVDTRYSYDDNGRVRTIVHLDEAGERLDAFAYEYDADGNVIRVTRGDNWAILYSYDSVGQLISERWLDADNQTVYSVDYTYDLAGNRIEQITRSATGGQSRTLYDYNNRNQLISETRNADIDIEDRATLPMTIAVLIVAPLLMIFKRRRLVVVLTLIAIPMVVLAWNFEDAPRVEFIYDANGNLSEEIFENQGRVTYQYDVFNRLTQIERFEDGNEIVTTIAVIYDAAGRVATIETEDTSYQFTYDLYGLVAVEDERQGITQTMVTMDGETVQIEVDGDSYWVLDDGLGTVRRVVGEDGVVLDDSSGFGVDAFGQVVDPRNTDVLDTNFIEQIHIPEADITLMGVRAYHTRTGRFMQRDWVRHDPRGTLYTYAHNNPLTYQDETGLSGEEVVADLSRHVPMVDATALVVTPTIESLNEGVSVASLERDDNARLLALASMLEFDVNNPLIMRTPLGCDVYILEANPAPEMLTTLAQEARDAMLSLYDSETGWLPTHQPEIGMQRAPLDDLVTVLDLRQQALQTAGRLHGCDDREVLPQPLRIAPSEVYDSLTDLRLQLDETSFLDVTLAQIDDLITILDNESVQPTRLVDALAPVVESFPSGTIADLQNSTHELMQPLLLPLSVYDAERWQMMDSAQTLTPAPIVTLGR